MITGSLADHVSLLDHMRPAPVTFMISADAYRRPSWDTRLMKSVIGAWSRDESVPVIIPGDTVIMTTGERSGPAGSAAIALSVSKDFDTCADTFSWRMFPVDVLLLITSVRKLDLDSAASHAGAFHWAYGMFIPAELGPILPVQDHVPFVEVAL